MEVLRAIESTVGSQKKSKWIPKNFSFNAHTVISLDFVDPLRTFFQKKINNLLFYHWNLIQNDHWIEIPSRRHKNKCP